MNSAPRSLLEVTIKKLLVLFLALVPASAFATGTGGVDVTWNDCVNGTLGTAASNKVLDCAIVGNRNYNLEFQYKTPISMPNFVAISAYADIGPSGAPLSPFWHYEGGGCNGSAIKGAQLLGVIPPTCADATPPYLETWDGGPSGTFAIAAYLPDWNGAMGRGRFVLLGARGDGYPVVAKDNMWAFTLRFNNWNGTACAGCTEQKTLVWNTARLESNDGQPAIDLSGADKGSDCAHFNNASPGNCSIVPTQSMSWGKIKSLFR